MAGDRNCHIELTRDGFEDVTECFSFGLRNQKGENMLRLHQENNLRVMSSFYQKRREYLVTCKSGGNEI